MADAALQAAITASLGKLPPWLTRGIDTQKLQIGEGPALANGYESGAIASVDKGDPHKITINDRNQFLANGPYGNAADQTLAHELMHVQQNRLHPSVKFAPYTQGAGMYDFGGPKQLLADQKRGKKVTDFNPEQVAAMQQYQTARTNDPRATPQEKQMVNSAIQPYMDQFQALPQTVIEPTGPEDREINTTPATPVPPARAYHSMDLVTEPHEEIDLSAGMVKKVPTTKPDSTQKTSQFAKGDAVTLPDGSAGKISYIDPDRMGIARVAKSGGGTVTVSTKKLKAADGSSSDNTAVAKGSSQQEKVQADTQGSGRSDEKAQIDKVPKGHVLVAEHIRKLPGKAAV